jgi:hypothetical protein
MAPAVAVAAVEILLMEMVDKLLLVVQLEHLEVLELQDQTLHFQLLDLEV